MQRRQPTPSISRWHLLDAVPLVAEDLDLTASQVQVLEFFAHHEDLVEHTLRISQTEMAEEFGCSPRSVGRTMDELASKVLLHRPQHGLRNVAQVYSTDLWKWAVDLVERPLEGNQTDVSADGIELETELELEPELGQRAESKAGVLKDSTAEHAWSRRGASQRGSITKAWRSSPGRFQPAGYHLLLNKLAANCLWCGERLGRRQGRMTMFWGRWCVLCPEHAMDGRLIELGNFSVNRQDGVCTDCGEDFDALTGIIRRYLRTADKDDPNPLDHYPFCRDCALKALSQQDLASLRQRHEQFFALAPVVQLRVIEGGRQ